MDSSRRLKLLACAALGLAFLGLYWQIFIDLCRAWVADENYSHGPVVIAVIAYLIWARRAQLAAQPVDPWNGGLAVLSVSLLVLLVGTAGVEFFLMRLSAVGVLVGVVLYCAGWRWLRILAFPFALTALVIPVPPVLFYQAAFPLQLLATKVGVATLQVLSVPVLREGNVIILPHTTLEVTEACSGIRSLVSLCSLAAIYGYFACDRHWKRALVIGASLPIAITANGIRIAGTGIAAHFLGSRAAAGFFHLFSGWIVFVVSSLMLFAVARLVDGLRGTCVRLRAMQLTWS